MEDFKFKKSFGQNFLQDENILKNIVNGTNILPNSLVIEIGPGAGALTKYLSKVGEKVLAYEIDTRLEEILDENLKDCHNVDIIFDDFLKRDIKNDIATYQYENIYVVANIPYYITTPILMKLIASKIPFKAITVMIQKEVGERFTAQPKTRDYGSITVYLNYYFDIHKLFIVSRNCFVPKPNVDSIVISLCEKENKKKVDNEDLFFKIIRDAFKFKRKNIRNNLKNYDLNKIFNVLKKYNKDLSCRAEELELDVFIDLTNELNK